MSDISTQRIVQKLANYRGKHTFFYISSIDSYVFVNTTKANLQIYFCNKEQKKIKTRKNQTKCATFNAQMFQIRYILFDIFRFPRVYFINRTYER